MFLNGNRKINATPTVPYQSYYITRVLIKPSSAEDKICGKIIHDEFKLTNLWLKRHILCLLYTQKHINCLGPLFFTVFTVFYSHSDEWSFQLTVTQVCSLLTTKQQQASTANHIFPQCECIYHLYCKQSTYSCCSVCLLTEKSTNCWVVTL